jgi:hypothetical protein
MGPADPPESSPGSAPKAPRAEGRSRTSPSGTSAASGLAQSGRGGMASPDSSAGCSASSPDCPWRASPRPDCPWPPSPRPVCPWPASPRPVCPWPASPRPDCPWPASPRPVCPWPASSWPRLNSPGRVSSSGRVSAAATSVVSAAAASGAACRRRMARSNDSRCSSAPEPDPEDPGPVDTEHPRSVVHANSTTVLPRRHSVLPPTTESSSGLVKPARRDAMPRSETRHAGQNEHSGTSPPGKTARRSQIRARKWRSGIAATSSRRPTEWTSHEVRRWDRTISGTGHGMSRGPARRPRAENDWQPAWRRPRDLSPTRTSWVSLWLRHCRTDASERRQCRGLPILRVMVAGPRSGRVRRRPVHDSGTAAV